jgi:lysophospholipase L1-like esterase
MNSSLRKKLAVASGVFLGLFVVLELAFRVLAAPLGIDRSGHEDYRRYLLDGHLGIYEPRPHTVYQHPRGGRDFNSFGFTDRAWSVEREPDETRILCLGGSTTEGGNPEGLVGSYPYLLEQLLEERAGRAFQVMNAGMSGWTSAEMLASWFLCLQDFAPDVLVLHEGVNDLEPRFRRDFRADYTHWRRPFVDPRVRGIERLLVRSELYLFARFRGAGVPTIVQLTSTPMRPGLEPRLEPETSAPFVRNLRSIARDARGRGARVVLMTMPHQPDYAGSRPDLWVDGLQEHNALVRELAAAESLDLVDAAAVFAERADELGKEFIDLVHVQPAGNRAKAELLADFLLAGDGSGALATPTR